MKLIQWLLLSVSVLFSNAALAGTEAQFINKMVKKHGFDRQEVTNLLKKASKTYIKMRKPKQQRKLSCKKWPSKPKK